MKIPPEQYQEAYRCASEVHAGRMRVTDAQKHLVKLGLNRSSAGDFVYILRRMLRGEVYKRAMSADATEHFITKIRSEHGDTAFRNALTALRLHIPYNGATLNKHVGLLAKYENTALVAGGTTRLPPEVRVLPMAPDESEDASIEYVQEEYFLDRLPSSMRGEYRCRTQPQMMAGAIVLFQYRGHIIATAKFRKAVPYAKPDRDGYTRGLHFIPNSIRVFDPVPPESMREIWPEDFVRFSHTKLWLSPAAYPRFQSLLRNTRSPFVRGEDGDDGDDDSGYEPSHSDQRTRIKRQVLQRRGQAAFRNALRSRYGNNCLVTGCEILALLEAAHITPYRGEQDNHPENGLLLRADIHTLFDLDLLGIDPADLRISLHPGVKGEYCQWAGRRLACITERRPSQKALSLRHAQFLARCRQPA